MKNAFIAFVVLVGFVFCAIPAQAQTSRIYFTGYLGLNTFTDSDLSESTSGQSGDLELNNAFSLAGAMGLRLTPQWRLEGEISYRKADLDRIEVAAGSFEFGGDVNTWLYMLNIYYDVDFEWKNFKPFLTAGLGFASHEAQLDRVAGLLPEATDDSIGFAWQLGGGLKYRVNPDLAISSNYRYIGTSDIEVDSYDVEYTTHEFRVGMEYDLPMDWFKF